MKPRKRKTVGERIAERHFDMKFSAAELAVTIDRAIAKVTKPLVEALEIAASTDNSNGYIRAEARTALAKYKESQK